MSFKISSDGSTGIDTDYYWIEIDSTTPRGVKLQLLSISGVATYGNYTGDTFWTHWAPLPKRKKPNDICKMDN